MGIKRRIQGLFIKMKNRFCVAIIIFCIILIGCSNNLSLEQASSSEENGETLDSSYTKEEYEQGLEGYFDIENEEGIYARNIISWNTETGEEKVILKRKAAKRWNLKITSQVIPKKIFSLSVKIVVK